MPIKMNPEKIILNVGLAVLENVMVCKRYPVEDSNVDCFQHYLRPGGNACSNSLVMSEFRVPCEFLGVMSNDHGGRLLRNKLDEFGVLHDHCVIIDCECPTSVVILNSENTASRTTINSTLGIKGLKFQSFRKLDLKKYQWINFCCRSGTDEMEQMIRYVKEWNGQEEEEDKRITVSLELGKKCSAIPDFIELADVVFISKGFSKKCGYSDMCSAAIELSKKLNHQAVIICPWGDKGACAKTLDGPLLSSESFPPKTIVDTVGAGDTFVAVTIMAMAHGKHIEDAIRIGCRVAGAKCGIEGIEGLGDIFKRKQPSH